MNPLPPSDATESKVIINLLLTTAVFCSIMGAIGYVVTRYPELIDGAATMVNGVAVAVPDILHTEPQTYRCRMSKEYVMEPGTNQVRTTATITNCGNEPTAGK
jgi:hypothetical protein